LADAPKQVLSLHVLESNGWTNKFFSTWFSSIESFSRVHDKKLSIAAIVALLTLNADQVPVSVQQGWPRLLQGIVRLFQTLPAAIKSKYNLEFLNEEVRLPNRRGCWASVNSIQAQKFKNLEENDSDDELGEESLLDTPLDKVEPYQLFKNALMKLQQEQPQLYESLTTNLNPEEQNIVQGVIHQADVIAAAAAAEGQVPAALNGA